MSDTPKRRGRPPGTPNPKAGRPKGSQNAKPKKEKLSITIELSKQEKAHLDMVCEFERLSQREVLMAGVKAIQLKSIGGPLAQMLDK